MFKNGLTGSAWARALQCVAAALFVVGPVTAARAQQPGQCLSGVERLMREYQSRYHEIAKTNPDLTNNVIDWPPCCPSEKAPAFPPDGYYDSALAGDPQFAIELVKAIQKILCEIGSAGVGTSPMPIASWFNRDPNTNGECGEVPGGVNAPTWTVETAFGNACDTVTDPVDHENYCARFAQFEEGLQKLRTIRLPESRLAAGSLGCYKIAYGQCGQPPEPSCQQGNWPAACWAGVSHCNSDATQKGAAGKAFATLNCVWNTLPCPPNVAGTNCSPHFIETASVSDQTQGTQGGCSGAYWATATRSACQNSYDVGWGDIAGAREVFFRLNLPGSQVDSQFRRGNIPGLPIDWCRVNPATPLPDWYCYPTSSSTMTRGRFKTTVGFGDAIGCGDSSTVSNLGCMFLGDSDAQIAADACRQSSNGFADWPTLNATGTRGWSLADIEGLIHPDLNTDPERGRDCGSTCSTCSPAGGPRAILGSVDFSWPLGRTVNDRSAGYLLLRARSVPDRNDGTEPENVISANRLIRNFQDAALSSIVVGSSSGTMLEYLAATDDARIEVQEVSSEVPYQTQVRSFAKMVGPTGAVANGLLQTSTTNIEQSYVLTADSQAPGGFRKDHIIRISHVPTAYGTGGTRRWEYRLEAGKWTIKELANASYASPARTQDETVTLSSNGQQRTTVRNVREAYGPVVSQETSVEVLSPTGWVPSQRSLGSDPAFTWTYDSSWRVVKTVTPSGHWTKYVYDSVTPNLLDKTVSQFRTNADTTSDSQNIVRETQVITGGDLDGDNAPETDTLRVHTVAFLGHITERTYDAWCAPSPLRGQPGQWDHPGTVLHFSIRCADPVSVAAVAHATSLITQNAWRSAPDRTTRSEIDGRPSVAGGWKTQTLATQSSDGSASDWKLISSDPITSRVEITETRSGRYDTAWSVDRNLRPFTRTVTVRRLDLGTTVRQDTYDEFLTTPSTPWVGSVHMSGMLVDQFDDYGRAEITKRWTLGEEPGSDPSDPVRTETRVYNCCGLEQETDETGITTKYTYDDLGRVITVEQQTGPTTYFKTGTDYDAAGRVVNTYRFLNAWTAEWTSHTGYNTAGRVIATQNADGQAGQTTYEETIDPTTKLIVRTETLPKPEGPNGTFSPPRNIRKFYPDGSLYTVNIPFDDARSASAPEWHDEDVYNNGGVYVRGQTRHASDSVSTAFPYTRTYTNALGETFRSDASVTTTANAVSTTQTFHQGHLLKHTDPDGLCSFSASGSGANDATAFLGFTPPSGMAEYFAGQWNLTAVDTSGTTSGITFSATSGNADRIALSSSWLATRAVGQNTVYVRRSATIEWKTNNSATAFVETSRTDTTLDGLRSWTESFGRTNESETTITPSTGQRKTVVTDATGIKTESIEKYGRHISTERRRGSAFLGRASTEYDVFGRVIKTHFLHLEGQALNDSFDDVTEYSYTALDQVLTRTDPAAYGGVYNPRLATTFTYDYLGRAVSVTRAYETTNTDYNARGQALRVRGFGVNPVNYGYDSQGRLVTLTTFTDAAYPTTAATTTWTFDATSGRLSAKRYHGTPSSSTPDASYNYYPSGRLWQRFGGRGIKTTYTYNYAGDMEFTDYSDTTPDVYSYYDRRGRLGRVDDIAGTRFLSYTDEGQVLSESVSQNSWANGDLLVGITASNGYQQPSGMTYGTVRNTHGVSWNSTTLNSVTFEHDQDARLSRVIKSGADVLYEYNPNTGDLARATHRRHDGGSTYTPILHGDYYRDRLGRLVQVGWIRPNIGYFYVEKDSRSHDIFGRVLYAQTGGFLQSSYVGEFDWEMEYDNIGQLTSASAKFQGTSSPVPGAQYQYAYDHIGNRISSAQEGYHTHYYEANALNQYVWKYTPGYVPVSGHSAVPNLLINGTGVTSSSTSAPYFFYHGMEYDNSMSGVPVKATIDILEIPGSQTVYTQLIPTRDDYPTYDADGNLSTDSLWAYEWDAENRLVAMQMRPNVAAVVLGQGDAWLRLEFAYDFMGRRISKRVRTNNAAYDPVTGLADQYAWSSASWTKYVYDIGSWNLSVSLRCDADDGDIQSADQSFAWGPDLSSTEQGAGGIGGLAIYLDDWNDNGGGSGAIGPMFPMHGCTGNITQLCSTEVDGNAVPVRMAEYLYGPFGENRGQTGPQAARFPFRWSTKFTDNETGLVYYGYRYYSASLGKWVSRDPISERGGFALYGAFSNNPVSFLDPLGLDDYEIGTSPTEVHFDTFGRFDSVSDPTGNKYYDWQEFHTFVGRGASLSKWSPWRWNSHGPKMMHHYLDGTGTEVLLDSNDFYNANPSTVQRDYERELAAIVDYAKSLKPGSYRLRSRKATVSSVNRLESEDWFQAVNGYQYFGHGQLDVSCASGEMEYKLHFWFQACDRFNFNPGDTTTFGIPQGAGFLIPKLLQNSVSNGRVTVRDDLLGQLHLYGWAQEFNTFGTLSEVYTFTANQSPSPLRPKEDRNWLIRPYITYGGQPAATPKKPPGRW